MSRDPNMDRRNFPLDPKRCSCGNAIPVNLDECDVCYDRALTFEAMYAEERP